MSDYFVNVRTDWGSLCVEVTHDSDKPSEGELLDLACEEIQRALDHAKLDSWGPA